MANPLVWLIDGNQRNVSRMWKQVHRVSALEPQIKALTDEQLRAKTEEFRERLAQDRTLQQARQEFEQIHEALTGAQIPDEHERRDLLSRQDQARKALRRAEKQALDDLLHEAFAVAREGAWRSLNMRPFDVQIMGAMVLHQGKIAEMKTGEGKTLVATLTLYLNALLGRGCHLVTTNDYLVRWQAECMGRMFEFLGLTCGYIQHNMPPPERRANYLKDITYVENSELGFDYLRDNMAGHPDHLVLRDVYFAIVDEVDNILVDEARTPLIISGMPQKSVQFYLEIDRIISRLHGSEDEDDVVTPGVDYITDRKGHSAHLTARGDKAPDKQSEREVEGGQEKVERMLGIGNLADAEYLDIRHHVEASLKAQGLFQRDVHYIVREGEVVIVDEFTGHLQPGRRYSDGLHQAIEAKEHVPIQQQRQTVASITYQNFFRLYDKLAGMTGTARTEETEFRQIYGMPVVVVPTNLRVARRDYPDSIFKTREAKYRGVVSEIMNLFIRRQPVLVGTRSVEVSEYLATRLAPDRLRRHCQVLLCQDRLWEDNKFPKEERDQLLEVLRAPLDDMGRHELVPILRRLALEEELTGPAAWDKTLELLRVELPADLALLQTYRERLQICLDEGIPNNVLNAKYHEKEGQIISEAGRPGQVTIATNMAGRGVDIVLGGKPEDPKQIVNPELHALVTSVGGLHVLGTERHESRRIDNQLRGRSGRQGDPGSSRFYVSLEDELMQLFGPERFGFFMRGWPEEQVLEHSMVSKSLERAQQKVELRNYGIRKDTLKYDDVMNEQRNVIYGERRQVLQGEDLREAVLEMIRRCLGAMISQFAPSGMAHEDWDLEGLYRALWEAIAGMEQVLKPQDLYEMPPQDLAEEIQEALVQLYEQREQVFGADLMRQIERSWLLRVVDSHWMEHLQEMDYLRDSIFLRAYAQRDPFIEYTREAHILFGGLLQGLAQDMTRALFATQVVTEQRGMQVQELETETRMLAPVVAAAEGVATPMSEAARQMTAQRGPRVVADAVGRNDPCPCGSGKKYKKCCGARA